jgi:hypothetical protein
MTTENKVPPEAKAKLVKVQAILPINHNKVTYQPGAIVEMTEEDAAGFCKVFKGTLDGHGEGGWKPHEIVRAKRVA